MSDSSATGGGTVAFTWQSVSGASSYRVARLEGGNWTMVSTVFGNSFTGPDGADDPDWRVYVGSGSCMPVPGPVTAFNPSGTPEQPSCTAPQILDSSDSSSSGAGLVSFRWAPVDGATGYRVARKQNGSWVVLDTVASTFYSGEDADDDPEWRVYVGTGTCEPVPGPVTILDPSGAPYAAICTAPAIVSMSDSNSEGAGTITMNWAPVEGATGYRVARRENGAWVTKATVFGTTYSGPDGSDDPDWRIYVGYGLCTPMPGPVTIVDPEGTPPLSCTAPVLTDSSDSDPNGAGTITLTWEAIEGASAYRVARRAGNSWIVVATVAEPSFTGSDQPGDPEWRVYVGAGSCVPMPGPTSVINPYQRLAFSET